MANITWNDIKNTFSSWEELSNSGLTWGDLTKSDIELLQLVKENNLNVPDKFVERINELFEETINTYNKYSKTKYVKEDKLSLYEKISIIITLFTFLSGCGSQYLHDNQPQKQEINITITDNGTLDDDTNHLKENIDQIAKEIIKSQTK